MLIMATLPLRVGKQKNASRSGTASCVNNSIAIRNAKCICMNSLHRYIHALLNGEAISQEIMAFDAATSSIQLSATSRASLGK
jgi:hypothetical protein